VSEKKNESVKIFCPHQPFIIGFFAFSFNAMAAFIHTKKLLSILFFIFTQCKKKNAPNHE
jgi:hypothetical protein